MADTPSNESAGGPWAQHGFVAAAAFLGIVIVAAVGILLINPGDSSDPRGGAPPANGSNGKPAAGSDPATSVCGLAPGSQQVPQTPPEAQWELVGTIAAPKSEAIGPGIEEDKRRLCFAHSPTGALFAAINFMAVTGRGADSDVLRELTAEGAARDKTIEKDAATPDDPDDSLRLQVSGFRVDSYSQAETSVDLAVRTSDGSLAHVALPLRWERRDWKVVIATEQGPFAAFEGLENLSGYVPWSGA